jgi:uncharacterized protein (TIGR03089 family)
MDNVSGLLSGAIAADPTRPQLTYYDDGTGERTELSGATLANWVAKTANLLVDGLGLGPGDRALVLLPPHWQTAAVLLGCWSAGLSVVLTCPPGGTGPGAEVAFVAAGRAAEVTAGDRYALGLHPLGLPLREVPPGYLDFSVEVRAFGDRFGGVRVRDQGALCADAARRATELGIGAGDRVLIDAASHPDPVDWLLAPLAAKATVVLCGQLDPARVAARVAAERVTRVLSHPHPGSEPL